VRLEGLGKLKKFNGLIGIVPRPSGLQDSASTVIEVKYF
jgi:hypothetical protein